MKRRSVLIFLTSIILLISLILTLNNTNAIEISKKYHIKDSVQSDKWTLVYEMKKNVNSDWELNQFLYVKEDIEITEIKLSTEFSEMHNFKIGSSEMTSAQPSRFSDELVLSSEYNTLRNSKLLSDEEMLEVLSESFTELYWKDAEENENFINFNFKDMD